ncbi:MAG: hypothetical protein JWP37_1718 [Mucilaginibacter sp.]|nr:hypothetical protein [Mucilaginibacter sp.]
MTQKSFSILAALSGILGVVMLITSFIINPGPPPNATLAQFIEFGKQHYDSVVFGGWLQAVSAPMIVLFAIAIVHLAGAATKFSGWATFFGGVILVTVSLIEITFYFSAINGTPATTGIISFELIHAVQHLFSIIAAPMLFFSLSYVILTSKLLPHLFGYTGVLLGLAFTILGAAALFNPWQYLIDYLSMIQGFWWLSASVTLLIQATVVRKK